MTLLRHRRNRLLPAIAAILLLFAGSVCAGDAELAPLAARSLLLDGQNLGAQLVAVGERGHILVSPDQGRSWEQRPAPTRATLTSVFFIDDQHGWAGGHDTTILRTVDGGRSWTSVHTDPERGAPVLDLWFRDAANGYAIGAYGLFLTTTDGGTTWEETPLPDESGTDIDLHFNQLLEMADGRLVLAAEAGHLFISADGKEWRPLSLPYEGSMFGTLPLGGNRLLAYGLRGHLFLSADAGRNWRPVVTGTEAILNDATRLRDGRIVIVGLAGTVLVSSDDGEHFVLRQQADRAGFARVLETADGALVLLGAQGARRLEPSALEGMP
jgi:photosystem II stability/assembly factor-like uncharacterized protein